MTDTVAQAPGRTPLTGKQKLVASIRIRRIEYQPVMLAIYLIPSLLSVPSASVLLSWHYALVLVMALLLMHLCDMTNVYADRDLDATYKPKLSQAVYGLGLRNVRRQMAVTTVLAQALGIYLAVETGNWDLIPLVAFTLWFGAQYSIPPVYLKSSGIWQIPGLCAVIAWLPMLVVVRAIPGDLTWLLLATIIGFGVNQIGIVMLNTAEDLPEDTQFGINTCIRALGLTRAMATATGMIAVGGSTVCVTVVAAGGFTFGAIPMIAAIAFALWHVAGTYRGVRGRPDDEALAVLRRRAKLVPLLVATTGWGTVIAAAFALAG